MEDYKFFKKIINLNDSDKINEICNILENADSTVVNNLLKFLYDFDFDFIKKQKIKKGKTIGLLTTNANGSGLARVMCDFANNLYNMGYKVIFIVYNKFTNNDYYIDKYIVKKELSIDDKHKDLYKIIKEYKINTIVHNNFWHANNYDLVLCKILEVKNIFYLHMSFTGFYYLSNQENEFCRFIKSIALCECLTVTNQLDYDIFKNFAKKIYVVCHPIDYIKKSCCNNVLHKNTNKILWIARGTDSRKRLEDIILIAKELINKNIGFEFDVVGPVSKNFSEKINKLNLEKHIKLFGFNNSIGSYLADAALFLSTSTTESFGMSLVEAMYFKKPIVMYNLPYLPFSCSKGIFSTKIGDYKGIANYIFMLLNDSKLRVNMGNYNRQFIDKLYDNFDFNKKWVEILDYESKSSYTYMDHFFETYPGTKLFQDEVKSKFYLTFKQEVKTVLLFIPHTIKRIIRRSLNIIKKILIHK